MAAKTKLTAQQVRWLRKQRARPYPDGTLKSYATLAKCVGCSAVHVRDIVRGHRRRDDCARDPRRAEILSIKDDAIVKRMATTSTTSKK